MNIDESRSSVNFTPAAQVPATYGMARTITSITLHHWGELGQDFDTVTNFLCNNTKPTSAHFVAEDGRVACIVSPADAAWHAGNAQGNATSIGIECRPEATDGDYQTVAELVAYIRSHYGPLPLHPHSFWFNTACPGVWDLARVDQLANGAAPTITAQGTITQEDFMATLSDDEKAWMFAVLTALSNNAATKADVAAVPAKVLTAPVPYKDPVTGKDTGQSTSLSTVTGFTDFQHSATRTGIPAAVLNQQFKLVDGTVTNLAGILSAIHAQPVTGASVTNVTTDPTAVANAVMSELRTQFNK